MPFARTSIAILLFVSLSSSVKAQRDTATFRCHGEDVSRVDIHASPPPFSGAARKWRAAAHAVGLHHATTQHGVITAFLSLKAGRPCTEFRRAESERVLRAQPFLSDAAVRIVPDSGGTVAVIVTTTDEIPVLVSGRFRGLLPESFSLGNENLRGAGLRMEGRIERGRAYRSRVGGRFELDALAGRPYRLIVDGDQLQLGHRFVAELEHPFFTDLQRVSWHSDIVSTDDYWRFERQARDEIALRVRDRRWDASTVVRLFGTHTVGLLGGAMMRRTFEPDAAGIVVSATGLRPDTGSTFTRRYSNFQVGRVGVIGGLRRVSFRSVNGFDALIGSQDVATGAMLAVYAAHGLQQFGEQDVFVSSALYAGVASSHALLATLAQVEMRHNLDYAVAMSNLNDAWDSLIGSSRTALYWGNAPGAVVVVSNELSVGWRSRLPLQLSFRDREGGLAGYRSSALGGAHRNVTRAELRWSAASMVRKADVGLAAFSEVGRLWKGDAPYGVNATRANVGVSLLAAYPTRAKRLYRVDVAIPLTRAGEGSGRVEVRFSSVDRTQGFWKEPGDVARSRTGTEPSRLFAWPTK